MSNQFINIVVPNNKVKSVEGSLKSISNNLFITKPSCDRLHPGFPACRLGGFLYARTVEYKAQNKKAGLISLGIRSNPVRATLCHLRPATSCSNVKKERQRYNCAIPRLGDFRVHSQIFLFCLYKIHEGYKGLSMDKLKLLIVINCLINSLNG